MMCLVSTTNRISAARPGLGRDFMAMGAWTLVRRGPI
jgi:hypothetical protein